MNDPAAEIELANSVKAAIALGFGNSVDYEITWNAAALEALICLYRIRDDELNTQGGIRSERDLVISILGFLKSARGGERFVSNADVIERFAERFEKKITLGGTAVRAAIAMSVLGYRSALHLVTQNDHVRRLIPSDSPYVCSNANDSSFPHLIVQFPKDARIQAGDIDIRTAQANRLIYHCNADNIAMHLNEGFADLLADAEVLLVSGFNAMQSERLLSDRLDALSRMMARLPDDATVFCEDGGYYNPEFRHQIYRRLDGRVDIYSMNEDELQVHLKRPVALHNVEQMRTALTDLHRLIPARIGVVHTQHWAVACGDGARKYSNALRAGVTMATARYRYGDNFNLDNYREIASRTANVENLRFAEAINATPGDRVFCVPVAAVDQSNATTIGLGDAFVGGFLPALLS